MMRVLFTPFRLGILGFVLAVSPCLSLRAAELLLVQDGQARITSVYLPAEEPAASPLRYAAADLREAVQAMSGAELTLRDWPADQALPDGPLVALGGLANRAGAAPAQTSLWRDSSRVIVTPERLLVGGESATAVNDAVMALLHGWGVRYYLPRHLPGDPGTIFPTRPTLALETRDQEWRPFVRSRRLWGHNMGVQDAGDRFSHGYVRRNGGLSAVQLQTSHAWSHLIAADRKKPDYYAIKRYDEAGQPVRGGQFCVSHPEVAPAVATTLAAHFRAQPESLSQSISPNDGGGACICLACQALDAPGYLEPSSGKPVLSDRYVHFYNAIATELAPEFSDRYLPFFVYSDYSRPPRRETTLHPMLVPVFAPIRYPRLHGMHNPLSEQNQRLRREMQAYGEMARQVGYYGYNYNLAEATAPFSKVGVYSQDLPWMAELNLIYISMETLGNWNTLAPTVYLSARYPLTGEEPAAIMDDFYAGLGGAAAAELRAYWDDVDAAFRDADVHAGSVFGIERILTPARLAHWDALLQAAAAAAQTEREKQVVALFQSGVQQGRLLTTVIGHLNALEIPEAVDARAAFRTLSTRLEDQKITSIYPNRYFDWFTDHVITDAAGILDSGGTIVQKLPSAWLYRPDYYDVGLDEGWAGPASLEARWRPVSTWGGPSLYEQGQGDWKGYQWFRITVQAPADTRDLMLWFGGNDGASRVWIDGRPLPIPTTKTDKKTGETSVSWDLVHSRSWRAFSVPVSDAVKAGQPCTIVLRIDHSLNELNLGGIIRPVMFYRAGQTPPQPTPDTYQKIDM